MCERKEKMKYDDVRQWIITESSSEDLERLRNDLNSRKDILVSHLKPGDNVRTTGLTPKYLNDLTGSFCGKDSVRGKPRGSVTLDPASTALLRAQCHGRCYIPDDLEEYRLPGIPMTCFVKVR